MSVVQQMLANPSAFLPEGFQWSEYVVVAGFQKPKSPSVVEFDRNLALEDQKTSPCCNVAIGGVMTESSVIGLCRGCGHVVGEFDLALMSVRVAEKVPCQTT